MEIKDILAYLRIIVSPTDTISIARVINVPKRGIGAETLKTILKFGTSHQHGTMELLRELAANKKVSGCEKIKGKALDGIKRFCRVIDETSTLETQVFIGFLFFFFIVMVFSYSFCYILLIVLFIIFFRAKLLEN